MIALWIVLGVLGYFTVGGVAAAVAEENSAKWDNMDTALMVGAWPLALVMGAVVAVAAGPYLGTRWLLDRHVARAARPRLPEAKVVER